MPENKLDEKFEEFKKTETFMLYFTRFQQPYFDAEKAIKEIFWQGWKARTEIDLKFDKDQQY